MPVKNGSIMNVVCFEWSVVSGSVLKGNQTRQWTSFFGLFSELVIHELTNAGFNILSHFVEEENLSGIIRGLVASCHVAFAIAKEKKPHRLQLGGYSSNCTLWIYSKKTKES